MSTYVPTREDAWELLKKYNQKQGLIRHALAVEAVMGHFARRFNEEEEKWRVIGLVHDLDYEMFHRSIAINVLNCSKNTIGLKAISGRSSVTALESVRM